MLAPNLLFWNILKSVSASQTTDLKHDYFGGCAFLGLQFKILGKMQNMDMEVVVVRDYWPMILTSTPKNAAHL